MRLRVDSIRLPGGRETTREVVEHSDCIAVIAVDEDEQVLLVKQFRQPAGRELLEIPAGGIEADEDPAAAVSRELREETGYRPQKVEKIGGFYSAPGYCTEYLHLYLATGLVLSPLRAEDTDDISLVRVPVSRIHGLIESGDICDAKSVAGLLTFRQYRRRRR